MEKVAAKGVDYFSAAGNQAQQFLPGQLHRGRHLRPGFFSGGLYFYGGVAQSFGATDYDSIKIDSSATSNSFVKIGLQWQSPYASLGDAGGATSDLDLYLINSSGKVVAESAVNSVGHDPIQYMTYTNTSGIPAHLQVDDRRVRRLDPGSHRQDRLPARTHQVHRLPQRGWWGNGPGCDGDGK